MVGWYIRFLMERDTGITIVGRGRGGALTGLCAL